MKSLTESQLAALLDAAYAKGARAAFTETLRAPDQTPEQLRALDEQREKIWHAERDALIRSV